ncbi:MAG: ExeM/NucH family extracellular endonuclease [Verrucomicrobia bacterium]|nr:ExeM/NucH family extracellular endonuclease [Verrucomicrobiota bacterium]
MRTLLCAALCGVAGLPGQVVYQGGTYFQSFDTLPNAGTFSVVGPTVELSAPPISASGLTGWSIGAAPGTTLRFAVDNGNSTTGAAYSYGASGDSDRSLGSLASGTSIPRFGAAFVNTTTETIQEVRISYTGQQWRNGLTGVANVLRFSYSVGAASIGDADTLFTAAAQLDLASPVVGTAGASVLDGRLPANQRLVVGQLSGVNWQPGQTLVIRWVDVNDAGVDDALAIDQFTLATDAKPGPLDVAFVSPANGATLVAPNRAIGITFNQPVSLQGAWFTINGSSSGPHTATVTGGPFSFALQAAPQFDFSETVTVTVLAGQVVSLDTGESLASDYTFSFSTSASPVTVTPIHTVQGSGSSSPLQGQTVRLRGVVTGAFQNTASGLRGFFVQAPDEEADANDATSEGIFVNDNGTAPTVTVGQLVECVGIVSETSGLTQLSPVQSTQLGGFAPLPPAVSLTLPLASVGALERYESMRVVLPQTLTVTNNFTLGSAGDFQLSNGRLAQPTNVVAPGAAANALQAANNLNLLTVNDGSTVSFPAPTPFVFGPGQTLRAGTTVTGLTGILSASGTSSYRLEPTVPPVFVDANPRTGPPAVGGNLKVVGANVLNYFNGNGLGGGFPTARGANTAEEFARQRAKIIANLTSLDADIYGLTEIENDGYGPTSALQDLVDSLNAANRRATYTAVVPAFALGTDAIKVALIYRTQTVEPVGTPATSNDVSFGVARPPLAQTFRELASGQKLTVCINHFRAKAGAAGGDPLNQDQGDGQGTNNRLRVQEAQALTAWLATDPTGSGDPDFLIIGDLNSYALEDPITALKAAGYVDLTRTFEGPGGYSYVFSGQWGHLDHALATPSLASQVTGAQAWHSNSDEPIYFDYNLENKSPAQAAVNVGTPYRTSDHDPIVVGLSLTAPQAPVITQQPQGQTGSTGGAVTFSVVASGTPTLGYQWYKGDSALVGATQPTLTLTQLGLSAAGDYRVVVNSFAGSATSEIARLEVAQTYAYWADSGVFGPRADRTAAGDPDRDGLANLLEFVQNTPPGQALPPGGLSIRAVGVGVVVEYRRRRLLAGVAAELEFSADLQQWAPIGEGSLSTPLDAETALYRLDWSGAPGFFRLRATIPAGRPAQ